MTNVSYFLWGDVTIKHAALNDTKFTTRVHCSI